MGESINEATFIGSFFSSRDTLRITNEILEKGIEIKASDIHIRDVNNRGILEYRIDGKLEKIQLSKEVNILEIISRLKILSKLNVAEKRMPQDGSFEYEYRKKKYDIRLASLPTIVGESLVLRILNATIEDVNLKNLGFDNRKIEILNRMCKKTNGLILITGPTGSGKSTTLLALLKILNDGNRKIITIEDPVENKEEGIIQIQVNEDIGLSFHKILRSVLRSDPDVIIISEIRDEITASIAIRASLTGHLVIATLHTNDVISTFSRLIDMNIPKYLLLDSLICILSQKLIRLEDEKKRICVSEILEIDKEIREILNSNNRNNIEKALKSRGFITIEEEIEKRVTYGYSSI